MARILLTGATGHMGQAVLSRLIENGNYDITVFMRGSKKNYKLIKKHTPTVIKKGINLRVVVGDIYDQDACNQAVKDADYIIHMASVIPPRTDHSVNNTLKTNYVGTQCLLDAIKNNGMQDTVKFVLIATVAMYGNRDYQHPWGRVGDPLVCSYYDVYGMSKIRAERYVLESGLKYFVSLRQTGVLYDKLLDNRTSGLMFQTMWNTPIEWTTDYTSAIMIEHLVEKQENGTLPYAFWRKCYNVGNGETSRVTGYETVNAGFSLMGSSAKDIFDVENNITQNFHCFWFYDSDKLNGYLDFRYESFDEFFKRLKKKLWYYKFGKPFKKIIKKCVIEKIYKVADAPKYWIDHNMTDRINAFYGNIENYNAIPRKWKDYNLICEGNLPNGEKVDYDDFKDITKVKERGYLLNHGYDESKADDELDITDMQNAASFRGGKCLSTIMEKGDLYTKLLWQDHDGYEFEATPYTVLKAGHWSENEFYDTWKWNDIAKYSPFVAQIWYDTHSKDENFTMTIEDCKDLEDLLK